MLRAFHARLNKPDRERQKPYALTYMWNLTKQKKLIEKIELVVTIGGGWRKGKVEEGSKKVVLPVIRLKIRRYFTSKPFCITAQQKHLILFLTKMVINL